MKKNLPLILLFCLFGIHSNKALAQEYWQQFVEYKINVSLNDSLHYLDGDIEITYHNNSPNSLDYIYFHLWPNAYKNEKTALCNQMVMGGNTALYFADSVKRGYISNLKFMSNGVELKQIPDKKYKNIDIAKIALNKSLTSGKSIIITTSFRVKIPSSEFSRLGHHKQSYQITQWYPKPAVYDAQGWHAMPYLNLGEFYSEFGNYDIKITLPKNYRVGATGDLVNGAKEIAWLDSLSSVTEDISIFDKDLSFPRSSTKTKTLHFHQENVHDFAWFADKRYHVLRDEIILENGKSILIQAMFTNEEAKLWKKSIKYIGRSTKFYSKFVGNYPYNHVTAVQGVLSAGAGMEYPNITIIGKSGNKYVLEETIMHEVGHNWFYGLLAFNERKYPWMDEGLNTFVQNEYMKKYYPNIGILDKYIGREGRNILNLRKIKTSYFNYFSNRALASYNLDQAAGLSSEKYSLTNYATSVYQKSAMIFDYLQQYLGKKEFSRIFKSFYEKWKFKHPQPQDLQNFFEKESGKNLDWVFKDLINSKKRVDYKICSAKKTDNSLSLKLKNIGDIKAPVCITFNNKLKNTNFDTLWIEGFEGTKTVDIATNNAEEININKSYSLLDYSPGNNFFDTQKLFHKARKLKLKFMLTLPSAKEKYLYFTPIIGWNNYDKFMAGMLIYNHSLIEKKWEYELMPLYSFNQKTLNGSFGFHKNFYTHGKIRRLSIGVRGKRYEYDYASQSDHNLSYYKLTPEVNFYFKNPAGNMFITKVAQIRFLNIHKEITNYSRENHAFIRSFKEYNILDIDYKYINKRMINPYGLVINAQFGENIAKASMSLNYAITYNKPSKFLEVRLFLGNIFYIKPDSRIDYSYKMSSWNGRDDYLFDYTYLDRSGGTNHLSRQMTQRDGGFMLGSYLGRSAMAIAALNLRTSIPFTNLIKLYANIGSVLPDKNIKYGGDNHILTEAGIIISVINHNFEIAFPLLWSSEYQKSMDMNPKHKYTDNIRFTMRLDLLDPFKRIKELSL